MHSLVLLVDFENVGQLTSKKRVALTFDIICLIFFTSSKEKKSVYCTQKSFNFSF